MLDPSAMARLKEDINNFEFVFPDIVKIQAKVKDLNIVLPIYVVLTFITW